MEQTVWLYFGVLTVLVGFTIIGKLVVDHKEMTTDDFFDRSLTVLGNECNFVCDSTLGAKLSTNVEFASGFILTTNQNRICGEYKDKFRCINCNCGLNDYTLDLNTTIAKKAFTTHPYKCSFLKGENDIQIECQG